MNLSTKQKQIHRESGLVIAKGKGAGEKLEWEVGASQMKTITYRMNKQDFTV